MRLIPFLLGASLLVLGACASVGTPANDALADALANPARSDSDRERDQRDLPGGVLLIVDHQARAGTGKDDAQELHRIEEAFAIADFEAHGLDFVGAIDVLRNSNDDHSLNVFDKAIRGKTDRFVHLYRKH